MGRLLSTCLVAASEDASGRSGNLGDEAAAATTDDDDDDDEEVAVEWVVVGSTV